MRAQLAVWPRFLASALVAFAALACAAQVQTTPAAIGPATLAATARLVYVDVVVRDSRGHLVPGLHESDFHVSEDGREQRLRFFAAQTPAATQSPATSTHGDRPPLQFSNVDPARSSNALTMVLFDLADTDSRDQFFARTQMIEFLRKLPPGRQIALFVLSDRLRMLQGFTGSSALLAEAARQLDPREMNLIRNKETRLQQSEEIAYAEFAAGGSGGSPGGSRLGEALRMEFAREDVFNTKRRLDLTANAFAELAEATAGYPGRKNLLWLSGTFPPTTVRALDVPNGPFTYRGESDRAERAIAASQIAVYPISVLGVEVDSIGVDRSGLGNAGAETTNDTVQETFTERQNLRETMRAVAETTGGRAIYGTNDIAGALGRALEDGETYYTLAYEPAGSSTTEGKFRHTEVKVSLPGISLAYRRGYFAGLPAPADATKKSPAPEPAHLLLAAMRPEKPQFTAIHLRSGVLLPSGAGAPVAFDTTVDVRDLSLPVGADGLRHAHLAVLLVALAPNQTGPPPQTSGNLNLNLTPEQYRVLLHQGISLHQQLALPTGRYLVRLGVIDTANGQMGTLDVPFTRP